MCGAVVKTQSEAQQAAKPGPCHTAFCVVQQSHVTREKIYCWGEKCDFPKESFRNDVICQVTHFKRSSKELSLQRFLYLVLDTSL